MENNIHQKQNWLELSKKEKIIKIIFFLCQIYVLLSIVTYLFINDYKETKKVIKHRITINKNNEFDNYIQNLKCNENQMPKSSIEIVTKSLNNNEFNRNNKLIWIGDSRTVAIEGIVEDNENINYICVVGEGYSLLDENKNEIKTQIEENTLKGDKTFILVNLGINDLHNINKYIDYYKNFDNPNAEIIFMTINPVDENIKDYAYTVTNKDINTFNNKVMELNNILIMDTNTFLLENGFNAPDGLHYDNETSIKIYNYVCNNLNL